MPDFKQIIRPVLIVEIAGQPVISRPSAFTLTTDRDLPYIIGSLEYPLSPEIGKNNDAVTITLRLNSVSHVVFTGFISGISFQNHRRFLHLADGSLALNRKRIAVSYRKEKAVNILNDILDQAGITQTRITCPDIEISRFSVNTLPVYQIIRKLILTLSGYGYDGIRFFFDTNNVFRFGTIDDSGRNDGERFVFTSGVNIIERGQDRIEAVALPIRHSQEIEIDRKSVTVNRTMLTVSRDSSRIMIWGLN